MRRAALLAAVVLAGCGGGHPATRTAASPRGLDGCAVGRRASVGGAPAVVLGGGRTAVVFLNESDEDLCSWVPVARTLAARGYEALLFDTEPASQVDSALAAARFLHGRRVVLMGASVGARAALAAAARERMAGVVALSAEELTRDGPPDLNGVVPHVRSPTLMVYSHDDPYVGDVSIARGLYRRLGAARKRFVLIGGDAHGTATLRDPRVRAAVLSFLAAARA